jgi:hypothetical protein
MSWSLRMTVYSFFFWTARMSFMACSSFMAFWISFWVYHLSLIALYSARGESSLDEAYTFD